MSYTLWSHGRLLGESPLDFVRCVPLLRLGELHTTPLGNALLARVTDTRSDALFAAQKLHRANSSAEPELRGGVHATPNYATIGADLSAAGDYLDALALELRRLDGSVVPTEHIDVTDMEFLVAFGALEDEPHGDPMEDSPAGDDLLVSFDPETDIDGPDDDEAFEDPDLLDLEIEDWKERPVRSHVRFQLHVTLMKEEDIP